MHRTPSNAVQLEFFLGSIPISRREFILEEVEEYFTRSLDGIRLWPGRASTGGWSSSIGSGACTSRIAGRHVRCEETWISDERESLTKGEGKFCRSFRFVRGSLLVGVPSCQSHLVQVHIGDTSKPHSRQLRSSGRTARKRGDLWDSRIMGYRPPATSVREKLYSNL